MSVEQRLHASERLGEQLLEADAGSQVEPGEQGLRARVEAGQTPVFGKGEQAGADGGQEFSSWMDREQHLGAALADEQGVLDVGRGHLHQRLGVALA
ncbi:MAG TPA: hypothetical protein VGE16_14635 [Albitalea sp.]